MIQPMEATMSGYRWVLSVLAVGSLLLQGLGLSAQQSRPDDEITKLEDVKKTVQLPRYEQWQRYADWFPENVEGMYRYLSQQRKDNR